MGITEIAERMKRTKFKIERRMYRNEHELLKLLDAIFFKFCFFGFLEFCLGEGGNVLILY